MDTEQASDDSAAMRDDFARALHAARERTLTLLDGLSDEQIQRQHNPLLAPLCWDLAHVANYEEQWLVRALGGERLLSPNKEVLYDAVTYPRSVRGRLPLLSPQEARHYAELVRGRCLDILAGVQFDQPLTHGGFVYWMVLQHEHQHVETMLAAVQLMPEEQSFCLGQSTASKESGPRGKIEEVFFPGGAFLRGSAHPSAYDNECPRHLHLVAPFFLERSLVTNGAFLGFVEDGGYANHSFWSQEGWVWVEEARPSAPQFWLRQGSGRYLRRRFGHLEPLPLDEPVQHIGFYEAEAFARWAGKRLPTEAEWEFAAQHASVEDGNLWRDKGAQYQPLPWVGRAALSEPNQVDQLFGDVWEWTSSEFRPYPGFKAFPYREYSEIFFGPQHRVLRGGSWATHVSAMRPSFRNWDYPIRRHIFAGVRLARSGT